MTKSLLLSARSGCCVILLVLSAALSPALAVPVVLLPDYELVDVGTAVNSVNTAQMAFKPGDDAHLFAVLASGSVVRYDYDSLSGQLSSRVTVASGLGQSLGLAFHGDDLYVTLDLGGSLTDRPGDGRITRLSDPDESGIYRIRHDFVHSIPKGNHDVNQLQIVGDTLYTGIGAVGRKGDPAQENIYSMTIARIADLNAIDFTGAIDADFKGPINYLADETEWTDSSTQDGKLRYYASGFRNPFGIAIDPGGDLWVSSNGNSDAGFLSFDYLYRGVRRGDQGDFPPASFGFAPPHITGNPITPLSNLGQNPSPTGMDFVPSGPDQGKVVLAQVGATNQVLYPVGKNVLLIDADTGEFDVLVEGFGMPTDVVRDPFGRLLISDLTGSIWLLTPPQAAEPAGEVPDGNRLPGLPLKLDRTDGDLTLTWGASCYGGDDDYEVYVGTIGSYYDHSPLVCTTGGALSVTFATGSDDAYYLVLPANGSFEGSPGQRSSGGVRPVGRQVCLPRGVLDDCP